MTITLESLRELRRRANVCLDATHEVVRCLDNPDRWGGEIPAEWRGQPLGLRRGELTDRAVAEEQRKMGAATDWPEATQLLDFIESVAGGAFDGWANPHWDASTAHAWLWWCGEVLSRWDRTLRVVEESSLPDDPDVGIPKAWVDMPDGRTEWFAFDDDFRSRLDVAKGTLDIEHRRAVQGLLQVGGTYGQQVERAPETPESSETAIASGDRLESAAWPPDAGWHFRPGGEFAFSWHVFRVESEPQGRILEDLISARQNDRRRCADDLALAAAGDGGVPPGTKTVHNHLSELRGILRREFGIEQPIQKLGGRGGVVWFLCDDLKFRKK